MQAACPMPMLDADWHRLVKGTHAIEMHGLDAHIRWSGIVFVVFTFRSRKKLAADGKLQAFRYVGSL